MDKLHIRQQPGGRPTLGEMHDHEELFGGEGSCSILISVELPKIPDPIKELRDVENGRRQEAGRPQLEGFPWQIWEGTTMVWEAYGSEYLKPDGRVALTGSARVPVGDLLQAVLDT